MYTVVQLSEDQHKCAQFIAPIRNIAEWIVVNRIEHGGVRISGQRDHADCRSQSAIGHRGAFAVGRIAEGSGEGRRFDWPRRPIAAFDFLPVPFDP